MAENDQNSAPAVTTSPTPVVSDSVSASPSASPTETILSQAPSVVDAVVTAPTETIAPVAEVSPTAEVKPTEDKPAVDVVPNILGGDNVPKEDIKADVPKTDDKSPVAEPVIELPTYEEFKLPENFTADKEGITSFSKILGEMELNASKLDHAAFQENGQKLIDLGTKAIETSVNRLNDYYVTLHEKQKNDWFESLKTDPELGRNRIDTTISTVQTAVKNFGGTEDQVAEFRQLMNETGVTNNPSLIRLINNMQQRINKYETESDDSGTRIRPAARPVPTKVKPHELFYSGNGGNK